MFEKKKQINELTQNEIQKIVEENDFIQQYKSIPKAMRAKLTNKQLIRMSQQSTLAESIQINYNEDTKKKKKFLVE